MRVPNPLEIWNILHLHRITTVRTIRLKFEKLPQNLMLFIYGFVRQSLSKDLPEKYGMVLSCESTTGRLTPRLLLDPAMIGLLFLWRNVPDSLCCHPGGRIWRPKNCYECDCGVGGRGPCHPR